MKQRVITGILGIGILIGVFVIGKHAVLAAAVLINLFAQYEYSSLIYGKNKYFDIIFSLFLSVFPFITAVARPSLLIQSLIVPVMLIFIKDILSGKYEADQMVYSVWGFIYVSFFLSLGAYILYLDGGIIIFGMALAAAMACDTFAYFGGFLFGRHKLCPQISPKKTVEGAVCGFLFAALASSAFIFFADAVKFASVPLWVFPFTGALIGFTSQFGDLIASLVKRKYAVKDYSSILPGHGGFMDRIDSVVFAMATCYCVFSFLGYF